MFTFLSLVTSIKDYIEIVHKLVETNPTTGTELLNYNDFGAISTYFILGIKETIVSIFTFKWLQNIGSLPLLVPDVTSAMLSEISVFDGFFHNSFTFLETPLSYGNQNLLFYSFEKFMVGFFNSVFLCLPTSTAHIITLRRFVVQGLEAGYLAGLGTLFGNILWIGSIVFGLRFIVIPWLSFDVLRYSVGFLLLVKYMWDSYSERRMVLENVSKWKLFLLNFLLAFTEQATIYPFVSNLSIGSNATLLETFPTNSFVEYSIVHVFYLGGLVLGGLTLLQFTCWFWENPAFNIYMWSLSTLKITTTFSQRFVNLVFLYLTMFFAISNVSYFGLDYTLTNPLGFVYEDRLLDQKNLIETSFLNTKASDRNTRRNRGRHGRRERWKRRVRRYRTFDASLYDQGVFDLFTIEDLNYGFDRFWLRRKIRNHRVRFRFFPGPWMRSFKKQLARPRLESFMGPRIEFFRILFEQAYHPEFHEFRNSTRESKKSTRNSIKNETDSLNSLIAFKNSTLKPFVSFYSEQNEKSVTQNLLKEHSALRKFVRKSKTRTTMGEILYDIDKKNSIRNTSNALQTNIGTKSIYSKRWKEIFSKISHQTNNFGSPKNLYEKEFANFYKRNFETPSDLRSMNSYFENPSQLKNIQTKNGFSTIKENSQKQLSLRDRQVLRYKTFLNTTSITSNNQNNAALENSKLNIYKPLVLFHPLQFYLQKEQAFQKKMKFYGASLFRNFGIENNAPYYRIMMKKFFYYYKPTLRWERTLRTATMRKARRKGPRTPRKLNTPKTIQMLGKTSTQNSFESNANGAFVENENPENVLLTAKTKIQKPTHFYSLVSKRATRYRYQIYKDVLQHWYYSPFNRLLLKWDVDSFIRRQPTSHFLTKKEENLLHLKRFLLTDYYNTYRWYQYMEHYNTMKNTIGKTKSFANRTYNQQFFGTFKKIRHLFAITPSLSSNNVLKFDQPLFNEYRKTPEIQNRNETFYTPEVVHEELLADDQIYASFENRQTLPEDLLNQSTTILKKYLETAEPIRKNYITRLIADNKYDELTAFLFKGQKTRGSNPMTNASDFLNQEKTYLLQMDTTRFEKETLEKFLNQKLFETDQTTSRALWVSLLKKCRNMLYNQEALKYYVNSRVDKLEKQKKREEKMFKSRLQNLQNWRALNDPVFEKRNLNNGEGTPALAGLTTSLQKSIKEGIYYEISNPFSNKKLEKSNLRNNRPRILLKLPVNNDKKPISISSNLKNHLNQKLKTTALKTIEAEKKLQTNFLSLKKEIQQTNSKTALNNVNPVFLNKYVQQTLVPFRFVSNSLSKTLQNIQSSDTSKRIRKPFQTVWNAIFTPREKTLNNWKKREVMNSTRKKIRRKIYRVLDQKKQIQQRSNYQEIQSLNQTTMNLQTRQKQDALDRFQIERNQKSWDRYETQKSRWKKSDTDRSSFSTSVGENLTGLFEKNFKRKRTRSRRYRRFKGRGPIKKHTFAEKLKRQFKLLKRYGQKAEGEDKKMEIFQMITKRKYEPDSRFEMRELKQRRTRQTKHRFWKKHKRQKYLQLKRKQRKRRRYAISKLRVLNKEFKRLKTKTELKKWWWQKFLGNFINTTNAAWQFEKNKQIQAQLNNLSVAEIFERDKVESPGSLGLLQIGNQDFKPLAVPESLRLRNNLTQAGQLDFHGGVNTSNPMNSLNVQGNSDKNLFEDDQTIKNETSVFSNLTTNLFKPNNGFVGTLTTNLNTTKLVNFNPLPFYAGWDENTRQFVVTNRLLSRKDAGYKFDTGTNLKNVGTDSKNETVEFTKAPLQGMNAATTLYWQIPFTTYDPDQFFALGMDGFSPLAWRFFNFKYSKQTTKPILISNLISQNQKLLQKRSLFAYNLQIKFFESSSKKNSSPFEMNSFSNQTSKNQARKIQKRQKRVKKHPRAPVWFPSGPLANQVLPVHYIYVFYKRTRLPRDRYIGRRFRRNDDPKNSFMQAYFPKILDFTLRKRVKPIRKYHRKRITNKNKEGNLILRRRQFKAFKEENIRFRPLFKTRFASQGEMLNATLLKAKQSKKNPASKQNSENLRIRQLRRRIQRQVLRPVARYKPRAGGFIWPGDYLRFESMKTPKLKNLENEKLVKSDTTTSLNVRKKKRRNIQEWQIQPKKYLLEKHNLKVLKKRLQKSQNFDETLQKLKQLSLH